MLLFLLACSTPAPTPVAPPPAPAAEHAHEAGAAHEHAAGDHHHDAPHGGIVKTTGDMHVEAVMTPAGVMFYLSDADQVALPVDGYSGSAVIKGPTGVTTADLMPMGDHLHAPATLEQGKPASVVLTFTRDGKALSVAFETETVGLASHDHTSLHGGQVGMWGDHHVEYAAQDGEYRFWITDAHRNPVTGPVSGSVKVGATELPLVPGDGALLSVKAADAGKVPVTVTVVTDGSTFSLGFNAVGG